MGSYREVEGDLFKMVDNGDFEVIAQGLNCFNTQGKGISHEFIKRYKTDDFPMELKDMGSINKLGCYDYIGYDGIIIVNCYTQYAPGVDFVEEALTMCLWKINYQFSGYRIGLPLIGGGIAGGDPEIIKKIIKEQLKDCDVTLVLYNK